MYSINSIRNLLKKYIDKKADKFIIYPMGTNGINVKNVLKDYFCLEPCFIVDNEYAKYNSEIIDKTALRRVYQKDMYVILTIENTEANTKILKELYEFVPSANIINLKKSENKKYDGKGLLLKDFLPLGQVTSNEKTSDKLKVRVVHSNAGMWNAISTICQAFKADPLFDLLLIITTDWLDGKAEKQAKEHEYKYIMWNEYQGETDRPDILILSYPFKKMIDGALDCSEYAKLTVVASWAVIRYEDSLLEFWNNFRNDFGIYRPDYYLFDSLEYQEIRQSDFFSEKLIEMGNAKYDGIYQAMQTKKYIGRWAKLKGKTTVLWATSHGIDSAGIYKSCTFDLYAKTFFEYAYNNQEIGFIFRPSFGLIKELIKYGFWSKNDVNRLKDYCADSPNIVYDDTDTYDIAFSIADGILTDAFCGIICSALPMLKPICAAYRSKEDIPHHPDLLNSLYSAYKSKDIIDFFEMIKNEQDPMLELRKKASKEYVKHFDGKNGWRIKEFIKEKYLEKEDSK